MIQDTMFRETKRLIELPLSMLLSADRMVTAGSLQNARGALRESRERRDLYTGAGRTRSGDAGGTFRVA